MVSLLLMRTVRGYEIISRSQELRLLHPFIRTVNLDKCLVQYLGTDPEMKTELLAIGQDGRSWRVRKKSNIFSFRERKYLLTRGGLIRVGQTQLQKRPYIFHSSMIASSFLKCSLNCVKSSSVIPLAWASGLPLRVDVIQHHE